MTIPDKSRVRGGTGGGARYPARLGALVLASALLGLAPSAAAQVSPNVYLRHCASGPPFGSTANETAMANLFGAVDEGWRSLCIENLSAAAVVALFDPSVTSFVFLDGSDRTATELAAFLAANRTVIETWVRDTGGKLFLNAGPSEGGNIDFGFGGVTLVFGPGSLSQGGRAVEPTHPIFNGPFAAGTQFTSVSGSSFAQGFIRDDMGRGDPPLRPPLLTTVIEQTDGGGAPLGRAALAELTHGVGLVAFAAFGSMTTDDRDLLQAQVVNLRANILAHVNRGGTNVAELIGGGPGGTRWIIGNDGGIGNDAVTANLLSDGGFCNASGGLRVADGILGPQADAFDDGLTIWINDRIFVAPGSVRLGEPASYTAGPVALTDPSVAGLKVTVEHVAAQGSATLRTLVRFQNPTAGEKQFSVDLVSNSGADAGFTVEATDAPAVGDPMFDLADRWIVVSDAGAPDGDPAVTYVVRGPGAPAVTPVFAGTTVFDCGGLEGVKVRFDLTVQPGETRALLFFTQLGQTPAAALSAVQAVFPPNIANPVTDAELLIGLNPAEIVNWQGLPTPLFTLTVAKAGSGTGTVTSDAAHPGIACGGDCAEPYPGGTAVVLTAVPDAGSIFTGWSGAGCSGTGPCTVTLAGNVTATATFVRLLTLSVATAGGGAGAVTSAPGGVSCGATCAAPFPAGTAVTLTAGPATGSVFAGFAGGSCGAANPCVVTLVQDTLVTATFEPSPVTPGVTLPLQVRKVGAGDGTVFAFASQASITCGLDCAEAYPGGTVVTLLAVPAAGSTFAGFGGDPDCADGGLTMTGSRFCTAAFFPVQPGVVSVDPGGGFGNGESQNPVMSADGRFVAFDSTATNLVSQGGCRTGGLRRVFIRDRLTGVTECVSVATGGDAGNLSSSRPALSGDGRFVAFESNATNLASPCAGGRQIFVRDRTAATTTCVSVNPGGTAAGNAPSGDAAVSGDGGAVAFQSNATNLAAGVCASGVSQVFVRVAGLTTCVSLGPNGAPGDLASSRPVVNADGSVVVFESSATNLVASGCTAGGFQILLRDRVRGTTECVSVAAGGVPGNGASMDAAVSDDGQVVAFLSTATNLAAPCTTGVPQVFLRNRAAGVTTCASVSPDGAVGNATSFDVALSGDGRVVAFASLATNLAGGGGGGAAARVLAQNGDFAQILRRNMGVQSSVAELVSQAGGAGGNGPSAQPALDRTGAVTVFQSQATNLRPGAPAARDDVLVVAQPSVPDTPPPPADRSIITAPAGGSAFPLFAPTSVTFAWTAVSGAVSYGFEFTGPNLQFTNPNAGTPDGVNGFGGGGGGFLVGGTGFTSPPLDSSFPSGTYQVRVIGLDANGLALGSFSDALTLFVGPAVPRTARPTITAPPGGTQVLRGAPLTFTWTETVPGVPLYFFEFTGAGLVFANPNDTAPDTVNGFGGAGGGAIVGGTTVPVVVPTGIPPGTYQVRVIGLAATGQVLGSFSNAITLIVQ